MPKIFLIKNRLLQQQQRLLETSKHASENSLDDVDEKDTPSCNNVTPRSLFGSRFYNASPSPVPREENNSDIDNDSDEPLSLVVNKGKL